MNRVITTQEILDFVMGQDPSKPVRMDEPMTSYECGCVMVHYGKEVLGFQEFFACGTKTIGVTVELEEPIFKILKLDLKDIYDWPKTYGKLQKNLGADKCK